MIGNFYLPINYFFVFYPAHHQLRNNLHHKNISGGKAKKPNSLLNRELGFLLCRNLELTNIFLSIILYSTKLTIVNQKIRSEFNEKVTIRNCFSFYSRGFGFLSQYLS